jgi:hypothetical protein
MKHPVINAAIAAFFGTCCTFNPTVAPRPVTIINIDNISIYVIFSSRNKNVKIVTITGDEARAIG